MRAAGIPLDIEEDDFGRCTPVYGMSIQQNGASFAYELDGYSTGYIVDVSFLASLPRDAEIASINLELPWQDPLFSWLADPQTTGESEMYLFPGTRLAYDRSQVINHRIGTGYALPRYRSFSGLLLGVGEEMPKTIHHGSEIPGSVRMTDQFGESHSGAMLLLADRLIARPRGEMKRSTRKRLFECPDPR